MIASGSRSSGLDIPFLEMEPALRDMAPREDSSPDLGTLEPGAFIAERYLVLRKIGEGGMGVLYACEDSVLAREVAVKLMQRSIAADPLLSERLLREARLAAQLKKHVAQVFDCGTLPTGEPYIVMELLHGRDLYSVLKESGPLPPARVAAYMLEVCIGLAEAHEKGIIHRDLKPENLYIADERDGSSVLKIVDFGVSKQLTSRRMRSQTNPTESVGSPQYMSPEQITTPSEVDPRTDIWSLGVVMFELLTGAVPFNGAGP
ncbi:MAG TPA: serine/threonine-protein kinase, partial [Polyangiaceae bacterium]|nr:serine/threonine-protein kinase [Polyangiaceae bacterium]